MKGLKGLGIQISRYFLTFSFPGLKFHVCETDKESMVFIFPAKISPPYPRPAAGLHLMVPSAPRAASDRQCLRRWPPLCRALPWRLGVEPAFYPQDTDLVVPTHLSQKSIVPFAGLLTLLVLGESWNIISVCGVL